MDDTLCRCSKRWNQIHKEEVCLLWNNNGERTMKEFTLTEADMKLLNCIDSFAKSILLSPTVMQENRAFSNIVWQVLGEKHKFKWLTARQHPKGEPLILAEPIV